MNRASLFLCHRLPFPPNKGDKIRSHALFTHLAKRGPVHLACYIDDSDDLRFRDGVRSLAGGECLFEPINKSTKWWRGTSAIVKGESITTAFFASGKMRRWVKHILATKKIDDTIVFGSAMAPYLLDDLAQCRRAIFDMVDVDSDKWNQYAGSSSGPMRWIYAREAKTVAALEIEAAKAFGRTLLVSPFEAETLRSIVPKCADRIGVLSNGVDLSFFSPGAFANPFRAGEIPIVMTGHMDYRPNADGAHWLATHVVPLLLARFPNAHVYFVGANPPTSLRSIAGGHITVTGRVGDVRPYLQAAQVVVAPLLIARGIQNKVLEAMAMKKCVVTTIEATRALTVEHGRHLWIANEPRLFVDAIAAAIGDPNRAHVMENARRYVEEHHDWSSILAALGAELAGLARDGDARSSGPSETSRTRTTQSCLSRTNGVRA